MEKQAIRETKEMILQYQQEKQRRHRTRKIYTFYPDEGPLRRELYKPHIAFFEAGIQYGERAIVAANRIGKTEGIGGYEITLHLTGIYPDWWEGRRFDHAVRAWAAGKTGQTVRDIIQFKLVGEPGKEGTALIPGDLIVDMKKKPGNVPDALEYVRVKHVSGQSSFLVFKSYDQKRPSFEGSDIEVIWLDEECPLDIYGECLIRTMGLNGIILLTFTPLMGLSETVLNFMPNGQIPEKQDGTKFVINATWEDAPHLTEEEKRRIIDGTPPYLRDARAKGIPQLGSGAIYPILEEDITIDDFEIPEWWKRVYGFDTGWNWTAAVWGAWDTESDLVVLYSAYKQAKAEPATHAQAIIARGNWIPGVYDQRAHASSEIDGTKLINEYHDLGLELYPAERAVEAGILAVWKRLVSGRLKISKSLIEWLNEFRVYRRDEKGNIVKENDHLMDATRGLILTGLNMAKLMPYEDFESEYDARRNLGSISTGRSKHTGY